MLYDWLHRLLMEAMMAGIWHVTTEASDWLAAYKQRPWGGGVSCRFGAGLVADKGV